MDLVHQDALFMRYADDTGDLTNIQVRTCLDKVARMKRVAEEMNVHKIRNDLRRKLTIGDKLPLCDDNVAMMTGNLR